MVRTTGLGRGAEGLHNLRVHLDGEPTLHQELLVTGVHLVPDPIGEDTLQNRGTNVPDPLLGHLPDLLSVRKVIHH